MSTACDRATLEAYADGALPPEEAARVEAHLAQSPAARAFVEQVVAMNALLAAAYDAPARAPLPEGLRASLRARPSRRAAAWRGAGLALAAGVALMIGVGLGHWLGAPTAPAPAGIAAGPVAEGSPLARHLDTAPSGTVAPVPGAGAVTLVATFLGAADQPCREFEARDGAQAITRGLACREADRWTIVVALVEAPETAPAPAEAYVPASGMGDSAIGAVLDALDAGMVLSPEAEAALIGRNWTP